MKNTYSIAQRNAIVEEHLDCIDIVMRRNNKLIHAAHLDEDDVYQQLALRMIQAVDTFDPEKGNLKAHIFSQLQYEILDCKRAYRLTGITGAPSDFCDSQIVYLDDLREDSRDMRTLAAA